MDDEPCAALLSLSFPWCWRYSGRRPPPACSLKALCAAGRCRSFPQQLVEPRHQRGAARPGLGGFINFIGPARPLHPDFGGDDPTPPEIYGMPYIVVDGNQPKKTVQFQYSDESDGVDHTTGQSFPFYPIPDEAITQPHWIEGG